MSWTSTETYDVDNDDSNFIDPRGEIRYPVATLKQTTKHA